MPQSLAQLHIHLVFATKHREPVLQPTIRSTLYAYVAGIFNEIGCHARLVNGDVDHVHALFQLARTMSVAQVVEEIKKGSSKWIKTQGDSFAEFHWQNGYAAFSVSQSNVDRVEQNIGDQEQHHRKMTFQDEYRSFLKRHGVQFDEQYVWD